MPQVSVIPARDDLPRGGAARAVAGLTAAMALHSLNRVLSRTSVGKGTDLTKATAEVEFQYCITGQVLRMQPVGDLFDLTGLTPVPVGWYQQYFFLVDHDENVRVQEAVASPFPQLVDLSNLSPNPYEATVLLLNAAPGWAVVGGVGLQVDPDALDAWKPGVDDFALVADGGFLAKLDFIDGFNGTLLLPVVGTGATDSTAQPKVLT